MKTLSRRKFHQLAGFSAAAVTLSNPIRAFATERPGSKIRGVQIGLITGFSYHNMPNDAEYVLRYMVLDGINATEMQTPTHEDWAGAPKAPPRPYPERLGGEQVNAPPRPPRSPEQQGSAESLRGTDDAVADHHVHE
jgi:hypothetical protein